jgi:hypothetical protein
MTFAEDNLSGLFELLRWLGPDAELLEPAEWREHFRSEVLSMAERYESRSAQTSRTG